MALNSVTLSSKQFFFQQACGLSKRTSHPSQGTSTPSGRGELAVLAQACMESCHVTACDSAWDHTCLLSEPALGNERQEPTSGIAGGQGWRRGWHRLRVLCGLGEPCWLQPLPQHKPMSSQEEFKGSKAILKEQGFGQCWFKLVMVHAQLMLGTGLGSPVIPADWPETGAHPCPH